MQTTNNQTVQHWTLLRNYPAWRSLEDSLVALARLLAHVSSDNDADVHEVAAAVAEALAPAAGQPESYRVTLPYGSGTKRRAPEGNDPGAEAGQALANLALCVVDAAVLLEAGHSAGVLGHALVSDVPRWWQAQVSGLLFRLRQSLQASRRHRQTPDAPPRDAAGGGQTAGVQALEFVVASEDGFYVVLPLAAEPEQLSAAHGEHLLAVLRGLGSDCAALHLLLLGSAAAGGSVSRTAALRALGLVPGRTHAGGSGEERCRHSLERLATVRVSVLGWRADNRRLEWDRSTVPLWQFQIDYSGQARWEERKGRVITRGEEWAVRAVPGSYAATLTAAASTLRHLAILVYNDPNWLREPLAVALAALLAARGKNGTASVAVSTRELLGLAGVELLPPDAAGQRTVWRRLVRAAKAQQGWGWRWTAHGWTAHATRALRAPARDGVETGLDTHLWHEFLAGDLQFVQVAEAGL